MKKVLVIVIAVVLVFTVSITAFAATGEREKEVIGENKGAAVDVENREERTEKLRELFADYHSEGLETLIEVQEAHVSFHENAKAYREEMKSAVKADFVAINAAVESGDLTKREGRVELIELRMSIRNMRNEIDEVLLAKMEAQGPIHDRLAEVREEVKALLEVDPINADAIKLLLEETLTLFGSHLGNDELYHGLFFDIAAGYGY